jgi:hypothetical protein
MKMKAYLHTTEIVRDASSGICSAGNDIQGMRGSEGGKSESEV